MTALNRSTHLSFIPPHRCGRVDTLAEPHFLVLEAANCASILLEHVFLLSRDAHLTGLVARHLLMKKCSLTHRKDPPSIQHNIQRKVGGSVECPCVV